MKRSTKMKTYFKMGVLASAMVLATGNVYALDVYLAAKVYTRTMPGETTPITVWGYTADSGGTCYNTTFDADRLACVNGLADPSNDPTSADRRIDIPAGDSTLNIYLSNGLPDPTSIMIQGQKLPASTGGMGPTWNDNSTGGRAGNLTKRVRSFGLEAAAAGGKQLYSWSGATANAIARTGTYLYHSGTHPQEQVYMGLSGAMTRDTLAGEAYDGVAYDNEVMLFYSDIDPEHNAAVTAGSHLTSIAYHPRWFLINGEPYESGVTPDIAAGFEGDRILLRMLSTSAETHVPTLQGLYANIHAEDGLQYNYQDRTTGLPGYAPREQYSVMMPPLKTKDAIITPGAGRYAVYDGNGYMTNPSDPADETVGDGLGGMLRFLAVSGPAVNNPPMANADTGSTTVDVPVVITVLDNDIDPDGDALSILGVSPPANGSVAIVSTTFGSATVPNSAVEYSPAPGYVGPDGFTYTVTDGVNIVAGVQVSVDVLPPNVAPVVTGENVTAVIGTPLIIDVLANDTDGDGDVLSVAAVSVPTSGQATTSTDNITVTYTAQVGFVGASDSFTYDVDDGNGNVVPGTVNVTVLAVPPNGPPVGTNDSYSIDEDAILDVAAPGVLANDTDPDGDALTAQLVAGSGPVNGRAGTFNLNADGSFHYEPDVDYFGADSFQYEVVDALGNVTGPVTVDITVNSINDAPVASDVTIYLTEITSFVADAESVIARTYGITAANGLESNAHDVDSLPNPGITAVLDTLPNRGSVLNLIDDGSFDYQIIQGNARIGTFATFTYHVNDGAADSNVANATIIREVATRKVNYLQRGGAGLDRWRVKGVTIPAHVGKTAEARLNGPGGVLIGTAVVGGDGKFNINVNNTTLVASPGDTVTLKVLGAGTENAVHIGYPVFFPL